MRSSRAPLVSLALIVACGGSDPSDSDAGSATATTSATAATVTASTGAAEGSTGDAPPTTGAATTVAASSSGGDEVSGPGTDTGGDASSGDGGTTGDPLAHLELEQTFTSDLENGWVRVERWRDTNPGFIQEDRFSLDMRASQSGQRLKFFAGDPAPHSSVFLLYYAPGWDQARRATPILLAHGANDQADRAWANPGESGDFGCGQSTCPDTGLMQSLAAQGYSVFAISHPHSQGDNYFWAAQIGDAIDIIRERTGAAQVDLIGWSKGVMATRMYTSSLIDKDWGTPYRGDVRRLVLIGGPNRGFDYIFRYGAAHDTGIYADYGGKIHAPGPHDELLINFVWVDRAEYAIFKSAKGDNFRGQLQMLARWDKQYPLTGKANNGLGPYPVVDSESTYYGEGKAKGTVARGKGIAVAIEQGSVIAELLAAGIPAQIETFLLCGDLDLDDNSKLIPGLPNEVAGPSDGIVFIDSCAAEEGIGNLVDTALLHNVNHLQLGWHDESVAQIDAWLGG